MQPFVIADIHRFAEWFRDIGYIATGLLGIFAILKVAPNIVRLIDRIDAVAQLREPIARLVKFEEPLTRIAREMGDNGGKSLKDKVLKINSDMHDSIEDRRKIHHAVAELAKRVEELEVETQQQTKILNENSGTLTVIRDKVTTK